MRPRVPTVETWAFVQPGYDFTTLDRDDPAMGNFPVSYTVWSWVETGRGGWRRGLVTENPDEARRVARRINDQQYRPLLAEGVV